MKLRIALCLGVLLATTLFASSASAHFISGVSPARAKATVPEVIATLGSDLGDHVRYFHERRKGVFGTRKAPGYQAQLVGLPTGCRRFDHNLSTRCVGHYDGTYITDAGADAGASPCFVDVLLVRYPHSKHPHNIHVLPHPLHYCTFKPGGHFARYWEGQGYGGTITRTPTRVPVPVVPSGTQIPFSSPSPPPVGQTPPMPTPPPPVGRTLRSNRATASSFGPVGFGWYGPWPLPRYGVWIYGYLWNFDGYTNPWLWDAWAWDGRNFYHVFYQSVPEVHGFTGVNSLQFGNLNW